MSKTFTSIIALVVSALLGAIGGYYYRISLETSDPMNETVVSNVPDSTQITEVTVSFRDTTKEPSIEKQPEETSPTDVKTVSDNSEEVTEIEVPEPEVIDEEPTEKPPAVTPSAPSTATGLFSSVVPPNNTCFASDDDLSLQLTLLAERMEKDSLWYDLKNPKRLQDCSGIFHRISQFVEKKCKTYTYPTTKKARDSRTLSGWFYENNNLKIIEDPIADRNLIRPGSVMFFAGTGKKYQNMTIDQLSAPYPNGIVHHIGVVTEVKKDEEGDVTGYVMMHGRRPGVFAQRSHYHAIDPPRFGYPPLGNWNQQWIAVGYIMGPIEN